MNRAYAAQCTAGEVRHSAEAGGRRHKAAPLIAPAVGTFAIGSGELGAKGTLVVVDLLDDQAAAEEFVGEDASA